MTDHNLPAVQPDFPRLTAVPIRPLENLIATSGRVWSDVDHVVGGYCGTATTRAGVERGEQFLIQVEAHTADLRQAMQPLAINEITKRLRAFVTAWPNAAAKDLAGYGAQLAQDVIERQPSDYAMREGLRHLRQTSKFLPAIAEVLEAVDTAQKRLRSTSMHIDMMPSLIERARASLAYCERRDAALATAEAAALARRLEDGKATSW